MDADPLALDAQVSELLAAHRRAVHALVEGRPGASPLHGADLLHPERFAELAESSDPVAPALVAWLEVLLDERWSWEDRVVIERERRRPLPVEHRDGPASLHDLLLGVLGAPTPGQRLDDALAAARHATELSARSLDAVGQRLDRAGGRRFGDVAEVKAEDLLATAEGLLTATDDIAEEAMRRGWIEGLRAGVGAGADRDWPARLTWRWVSSVFAGTDVAGGLRLGLGGLGRVFGACSFARALGSFGVAVQHAGRPRHMPRALHSHPFGHRSHRRRALFAGILLEPRFGERVLGLGRERALEQSRHIAFAFAASLRLDAFRVLVGHALRDGRSAAEERRDELSQRLFGDPLPSSLLGVIPALRPAQGAAFAGTVLASLDHRTLVANHDVDWFQNPRAIGELRHGDEAPRDPTAIEADALVEAVAVLAERLQAPFG